jgi:hypothetical protein
VPCTCHLAASLAARELAASPARPLNEGGLRSLLPQLSGNGYGRRRMTRPLTGPQLPQGT